MKTDRKSLSNYFFTVLVLVYFLLTFLLPTNHQTMMLYHLTTLQLRLLDLTVILPQVIIWIIAYYSFVKLYSYSRLILKHREGKQLVKLALGLGILAYGQLTNALLSAVLNYVALHHLAFVPSSVIINNYLNLAIPLIAFVFIGVGARGLLLTVKQHLSYRAGLLVILLMTLISVGYCYLVFNNALTTLHLGVSPKPIYYLPKPLILFTLVVPYIFMWFIGLLAAFEIGIYIKNVSGKLYKRGMNLIALGFGFIICLSIILQYLTTLTAKLLNLRLGPLLAIIYPLIVFILFGYILVGLGAKKLQKIEEV